MFNNPDSVSSRIQKCMAPHIIAGTYSCTPGNWLDIFCIPYKDQLSMYTPLLGVYGDYVIGVSAQRHGIDSA